MAEENKNTNPESETKDKPGTVAKTEDKKAEVDYKAEYEKMLAENAKLKQATDKACGEAAEFKRQLREKQTEAERAEAERAEKEAATLAELEKYRTESRINGYKTKLMESGYDLETAASMAAQLPEGVGDDFFAKQKAFMENKAKSIEAELLNKQPKLSQGGGLTQKDIDKSEYEQMRKWAGL